MQRLIMLNQMAGPLFIDLADALGSRFPKGCILYTAHPDALGKFSNGYSNVQAVCSPSYERRTLSKRFLSWVKYLLGASRLILFAKEKDVFLLSTNPPLLGFWFWMLSKIKKSPYLIVVYDLYPEVLVASGLLGKNSLVVKVWNFLNAKAYREALSVITISNGLANKLIEVHQHIRPKIHVIYPWADTEFIKPLSSQQNDLYQQFNPDGKKIILYAGNMGISHDIESMVHSADLLKDRKELLFLFVGGGEAYQFVVSYKRDKKLNNLSIYGFQPLELLPHLLSLATVSLVALEEGKQHLMVPSKLFYYLAAGSAVVGLCSGENDMQGIIESNNCGLCVPPGNPKALAKVLVDILDDDSKLSELSTNARSTAIEKFSKELGVSQFVENFYRCGLINKGERL